MAGKCFLGIISLLTLPFMAPAESNKKDIAPNKDFTILTVNQDDYTIGSKAARVVMFEYSSLSCPHCQYFHSGVFQKLKKNYIDNGSLLYVYRSFPTNSPALAGSKLTHCVDK